MNTAKRKTTRNQKGDSFQEKVIQISRVTKVCKGGKKLAFRAVIAVGNENGKVGVGVGKADDVVNAISKAIVDAKRNLIDVFLTKTKTIPHNVTGNFGACSVLVKPASQGTGVIAGSSIRILLELAGVKNIVAKQLGSKNLLNNARATISAFESIKNPVTVSQERQIPIEKLYT
jgi:small subunit ribosomal protein S5